MKTLLTGVFFVYLYACPALAQERRALVIGIDKYVAPAGTVTDESGRSYFGDLDGCKNDAEAIKENLKLRFGFQQANIAELYDGQATRQNIIDQLKRLLQESKKNDIAFFYYAGHGSQQKNTLTKELDKYDETIVPSDTWKKGIGDIRDKEQAAIYNAFLDKGVKLTVILDCCHSGSMSRGAVYETPKYRYLAANDLDAKDPTSPVPPETKGNDDFLMISATQDNQLAQEQRDEKNIPHGAFTIALLTVMRQQPVDASVINILSAVRAILKSNGKSQEPTIAASQKRQQMNLLGLKPGVLSDKILIPIQKVNSKGIELAAGLAIGLRKNNQLTLASDTSVVLKIDSIISINKSLASLLRGDAAKVKAGELFEVSNWVGEGEPLLRVFIPKNPFTYDEVAKMAASLKTAQDSKKATFLQGFGKYDAASTYWYENGKLCVNKNGVIQKDIKIKSLLEIAQLNKGDTVFFNLPVPLELAASLKQKLSVNANIEVTDNPLTAQYNLAGGFDQAGKPAYFLMLANASIKDSLESMPLKTDMAVLNANNTDSLEQVAETIYDYALRLGRVRGWVNVSAPGTDNFPFRLVVKNGADIEVDNKAGIKVGETASIYVEATEGLDRVKALLRTGFIYVFAIDHAGTMQLVFPNNGNDNRFPQRGSNGDIIKDLLLTNYTVSEPIGTDNFYLLATVDPIPNAAQIFNQAGVYRTKDASLRGAGGPLDALLNAGTEGTRGFTGSTPANWNLLKLGVKASH